MELADPDANASLVDRWINRVVEVIGVAVLATIVVLVFSNAVGRYAIATPIIWADEVVIALVPWLAMCGVFLSVRRRNVIRIDFFLARLPPILQRAAAVLTAALSAAAFTYLAINSFQYVALFGRDTTVYLRLPTGWFTSAMVIGATGAALAFLVDLARSFRSQR
ncbi:MAG: TRAP transporter small permease [Acidimicrobiia bacterium]